MLRVLHVHSGNLFGGVERVMLSLSGVDPAVVPLQHEFALCFPGRLERELKERGARVHPLGEVRARKPWSVWKARRRLRRLLREEGFDVLMTQSVWAQAMFGATAQRAGTLQVAWIHDVVDGKHWLQRIARRSPPDRAVCNSRFTASRLPLLYPGVPSDVVYCPLEHTPETNPAVRSAVRKEYGLSDGEVLILHLGRLEPFKGHALLLDALARVRDIPRWTCWIVGNVQRPEEALYLRSLQRRAEKHGLTKRVRFFEYEGNVARLFAAADVYCQPNAGPEAFGLTFIEAMHAGLPVVTTNFGGGAEVVDGCGLLVEPGSVRSLAGALFSLLDEDGGASEVRSTGAEERRQRARALTDPTEQSALLAGILEEMVATG